MAPKIRAAIFDLDGTLVDSLAHIAAACNDVLTTHGRLPLPIAAYARFAGGGNTLLLERTFAHVALPTDAPTIAAAVAQKRRYDDAAGTEHLQAFPHAANMLGALTTAGLRLAVLSNKTQHLVRLSAAHCLPHTTFAVVHGARDDVPLKPSATPALAILHEHFPGLRADECAFIGDTPVDMHTARNAGMLPIGVSWGFRSKDELVEAGAHVVVDDMEQLRETILKTHK